MRKPSLPLVLLNGLLFTAVMVSLITATRAGARDEPLEPLAPPSPGPWRPIGRPIQPPMSPEELRAYHEAIKRTANMVGDSNAVSLAARYGLHVMNLTWEDTGRYKGSSVGPNISDMTIQVQAENPFTGQLELDMMPVIRKPNFEDVTADVDPHAFTLLVGNEKGRALQRISLAQFLKDPKRYLHDPGSWPVRRASLWAERDSRVLVSAQACFLPVPQSQSATFNPVLFNYQSERENPAVLTLLVTREGTSATIIDNVRDGFGSNGLWGQRLFHNANGMRASLTGQRLTDFRAAGSDQGTPTGSVQAAESALNMVLLVQIPLKQREVRQEFSGAPSESASMSMESAKTPMAGASSDVEAAVIGHGDLEGPFTEIDGLWIERDPRFPVRVTVQFYKATSNGIVSERDLLQVNREIESVYAEGDQIGSLVVGGMTGRITEYEGAKVQPARWWQEFWDRYERNTGHSREDARAWLREHLGTGYSQRPVCELYLHDVLRQREM